MESMNKPGVTTMKNLAKQASRREKSGWLREYEHLPFFRGLTEKQRSALYSATIVKEVKGPDNVRLLQCLPPRVECTGCAWHPPPPLPPRPPS